MFPQSEIIQTDQALTIPTFFIESPKRHLPFVNENLTYETAPEIRLPIWWNRRRQD